MIDDDLAAKLADRGPNGLEMDNDLEYLLGLVGHEALESDEFDDDFERAAWAVAQWCQELQYVPDLRDYQTGKTVSVGTVPEDRETAELRERQEEAESR